MNFWIYLDTLTDDQWRVIKKRYCDMSDDERDAAFGVARKAAEKTTSYWQEVYIFGNTLTGGTTWELIGSHELLKQQKPLIFLPIVI